MTSHGYLGEIALDDVGGVDVVARVHASVGGLGLGERVAVEIASGQHLQRALQEIGRGQFLRLPGIVQSHGIVLHCPMDVGETRQRLTLEVGLVLLDGQAVSPFAQRQSLGIGVLGVVSIGIFCIIGQLGCIGAGII